MGNLVWLASYPKSGSTWMRAFLTAYLAGRGVELDVNDLDASLHAGSRILFDRVVGYPSSDLTDAQIDDLRPGVYRAYDEEADGPVFLKVHDAWRRTPSGESLFPAEVTRTAVLIVRNPLAVAPSLANHSDVTIDEAIAMMRDPGYALSEYAQGLLAQLRQPVGTWSQHTESWLVDSGLPLHLVTYEQLRAHPHATFSAVLAACGIEPDPALVDDALERTRFERLQAAERAAGFKERTIGTSSFFRKGAADAWREELNSEQIEAIAADHHEWMLRLGYLPPAV